MFMLPVSCGLLNKGISLRMNRTKRLRLNALLLKNSSREKGTWTELYRSKAKRRRNACWGFSIHKNTINNGSLLMRNLTGVYELCFAMQLWAEIA